MSWMSDLMKNAPTFEVGDEAWIYLSDHSGEMTKGTVVAVLNLPGWSFPNYVVEIPTSIEPLLEVRGGPLGIRKSQIES